MMKWTSFSRLFIATCLVLTSNGIASPVNSSPPRIASVQGRIEGIFVGDPFFDTYAGLYRLNTCGQRRYVGFTPATAARSFTFENLTPGTYFLKTFAGLATGTLAEFYDGTQNLNEARPIAVVDNQTTFVTVTLRQGAQIAGKVTDAATGDPVPSAYYNLYDKSTRYLVAAGVGEADGTYRITSLPAGEYWVMIYTNNFEANSLRYIPEFYSDRHSMTLASSISVTVGAVITNVNVALSYGSQISGVVSESGTGQPVYARIYARSLTTDLPFPVGFTDNNGSYTTRGLPPGEYRIEFETNGTHFPQLFNQQPITGVATMVSLTSTGVVPNINASLQKGGQITGTVTFTDGSPAYTTIVQVLDATTGQVVGYGNTSTGDLFVTGPLPSGRYKVLFGKSGRLINDCFVYFSGGYYNQKIDFESADVITLTAPQVVSNVNGILSSLLPTATNTKSFLPFVIR